MRTQLLAELRDARAKVAAAEVGALGDPARFSATVAASPVELHVFEDALLVMAGGQAKRIAFSFVADVRARDYTVTIEVTGQDPLAITRLGRRAEEFAALLGERLRAAKNRTAAFLGSLLPGLDPLALRAAAGLLRDGVAVPAARSTRSTRTSVPPCCGSRPRRAGSPIAGIADRADLAIGFKQVASVRRADVGGTPWRDPSLDAAHRPARQPRRLVRPRPPWRGCRRGHVGDRPGRLRRVRRARLRQPFGGGPGGYADVGGYSAFRALGAAMNPELRRAGTRRPPRAGVRYGLLTPETEDLAR